MRLSWMDLWTYYRKQNRDIQLEVLKEIDLPTLLGELGVQHQIEVIKGAPRDIIEALIRHKYVHFDTVLAFGFNPWKYGYE